MDEINKIGTDLSIQLKTEQEKKVADQQKAVESKQKETAELPSGSGNIVDTVG